jgi:hypothetical protein
MTRIALSEPKVIDAIVPTSVTIPVNIARLLPFCSKLKRAVPCCKASALIALLLSQMRPSFFLKMIQG